jgi:proline dehydrogenase
MINKLIARIIPILPERLVWLFSKRYIAGKLLSDAVQLSTTWNKKGIRVTLDVLGEYIRQISEAEHYRQEYLKTIDAVKDNQLNASISVKPSMFGLLLDKEFCYQKLREVVAIASSKDISICLDMEDSSCTDDEIDLFEKLYTEFPAHVSFVLQAYLHRTLGDLEKIKKFSQDNYPVGIRICKGIYIEPENIAYQSKKNINKNYLSCLDYMMQNGFYCSIATHDKYLIDAALELIRRYNLSTKQYEFQMLYGVRPELGRSLSDNGHPLRIYVPYGTHWFGYSTRRLKENPRMISHILKALLIRG